MSTLGVVSCVSVSSGQRMDAASLASVVDGKSTEAELMAEFGQPAARTLDDAGHRRIAWIYTRSRADRPLHVNLQQQMLTVILDESGRVLKHEVLDTVSK
jgi:hypothetical protein